MDRIKPWGWHGPEVPERWSRRIRLACAWALGGASAALDRLARELARADDAAPASPQRRQIEFHAESGAPEGALYIDGKLVGWIDGVRRL